MNIPYPLNTRANLSYSGVRDGDQTIEYFQGVFHIEDAEQKSLADSTTYLGSIPQENIPTRYRYRYRYSSSGQVLLFLRCEVGKGIMTQSIFDN